jgi:hypothetical protein
MGLYEPEQISTFLESVLDDTALMALLPGGVHETDAADGSASPGVTVARRATPYLVYSCLAGAGDTQGAGGTILWSELDYGIQVMHRPGEVADARESLRLVQGLLEGVEVDIAESGDISAHSIVVRGAGPLPRTADRETGGRLIYAEGRRWRIKLQRI